MKLIERTFINVINTDTEIEDINNYIYHHEYILSCFRREYDQINECVSKVKKVCMHEREKCEMLHLYARDKQIVCMSVCVFIYIYLSSNFM